MITNGLSLKRSWKKSGKFTSLKRYARGRLDNSDDREAVEGWFKRKSDLKRITPTERALIRKRQAARLAKMTEKSIVNPDKKKGKKGKEAA